MLWHNHISEHFWPFGCGQTLFQVEPCCRTRMFPWACPQFLGAVLQLEAVALYLSAQECSPARFSPNGKGQLKEIQWQVFVHRGHFNSIAWGAIRKAFWFLLTGSKKWHRSRGGNLTTGAAAWKQMLVCPVWADGKSHYLTVIQIGCETVQTGVGGMLVVVG